jgi:nitrate reductase gamma subunit
MNDHMLFAVGPYVGLVAFILGSAFRIAAAAPGAAPPAAAPRGQGAARHVRILALCACALAAGHLVLLLAPDAVLRWNRSLARLLVAEGIGIGLGSVSLAVVAHALWRRLAGSDARSQPVGDVIAWTLLGLEIATGVVFAVFYRWASSWSVVTLTPYAVSVLQLGPRVELVAATPFLVRLHVFCAGAMLVVLPFTTRGSLALATVRRVVETALAPAYASARTVITARIGKIVREPGSFHEEGS